MTIQIETNKKGKQGDRYDSDVSNLLLQCSIEGIDYDLNQLLTHPSQPVHAPLTKWR